MENMQPQDEQPEVIVPLTEYQQSLVDKYYTEALRIGHSFKSSVLYDDEKEDIAIRALIRVAQHYDENRRLKKHKTKLVSNKGRNLFNTFLYRVIMNALLSKGRINKGNGKYEVQKKRVAKDHILLESVIEAKTLERGKLENLSTLFAVPDDSHEAEFVSLVEAVMRRLSDKQRMILETFMYPESVPEFRNADGTPKFTHVTLDVVGQKFGVTRERIRQHLVKIQEIAKSVMAEQER